MKNYLGLLFSLLLFTCGSYAQVTMIEGKAGRDTSIVRNYIKDGNAESYTKGCRAYTDTYSVTASSGLVDELADTINVGPNYLGRVGERFNYVGASGAIGGLTSGNDYYIVARGGTPGVATTIQVSATQGGAAIDLTSDGSGTQEFHPYNPSDATGGTVGSRVVLQTTNSNPLELKKSFYFNATSAAVGDGFSCDFTIDARDNGRVLDIAFDYLADTGTFAAGTSSTDSDLKVFIVELTNDTLPVVFSPKMFSGTGATLSDTFRSSFQTHATSKTYRIAWHRTTSGTKTFALRVDSISVGANRSQQGAFIGPEIEYTPVVTHDTGSASNYTAKIWYRQVGDRAVGRWKVSWTGAAGSFTGFYMKLPFAVDNATNFLGGGNGTVSVGNSTFNDFGTTNTGGTTMVNVGSSLISPIPDHIGTHTGTVPVLVNGSLSNTFPFTITNGDAWFGDFDIKVTGWSSSVRLSEGFDGRPITGQVKFGANQGVNSAAWTKITTALNATAIDDKVASWDGTNKRWVVKVGGDYTAVLGVNFAANSTGSRGAGVLINGQSPGSNAPYSENFISQTNSGSADTGLRLVVFLPNLKIGDYIEAVAYQNSGGSLNILSSDFSITKNNTTQTVAQAPKYSAYYTFSGTPSFTSTAGIANYDNRVSDTHGQVTTGASWKFNPQIAGDYSFNASVLFASAVYTIGQQIYVDVYKNGVQYKRLCLSAIQTTTPIGAACNGNVVVPMVLGDNADIRIVNERGSTATNGGGLTNSVYITLIK